MLKDKIEKISDAIEKRGGYQDTNKECVCVALLSLLVVFGITCGVGTLTSGFHLVDDHEFARWSYEMQHDGLSLWDIISYWIPGDLWWRYEPAYYTMRILGTGVFGINLVAFSIIKSLQISISCFCLYYCGRLMGARKTYSFLFALISLVGYQSAVWWKLGPQEAQCTMWFSIGFLCMLKWLKQKKHIWGISSIISFFIMCNYKESFILLIPFLVCYVVYATVEEYSITIDMKEKGALLSYIRRILECLKGRYWFAITMTVIFFVLVGIIVFVVGVNDYDGVGLNAEATLDMYAQALSNSMQKDLKWFKRFGILFAAIMLTYWEDLKKLWKEILLAIVFLLPQFIIFAQVGITERYILPSAIGYSFFFVIILSKWKALVGKRRLAYIAGLLLLLLAHTRAMLIEADYFRYRGESVTGMLETVRDMTDEDTKILSCLGPNEEGNLTMRYWMGLQGIEEVYYWNENLNNISTRSSHMIEQLTEGVDYETRDFADMDIVVMYNRKDRHYSYEPSLDLRGFTQIDCGTLTIWVRDGQGIDLLRPEIRETVF